MGARFRPLVLRASGLAGCAAGRDYADCNDRLDDEPTIAACSRVIRAENFRRIFGWAGPSTVVAAYRQRGSRYLKKGDFRNARDDFNDAIRLYRDDRELFFGRAVAFQGLGDHNDAIEDYTRVIRWPARNAIPYYGRGRSYQAQGDHDRAIADFTDALKLDPGDPFYYDARALSHQRKGHHDRAVADLNEASRLMPYDAGFYA